MTSLKFATKQEQTLHYTSNETNLFSTLDAQSSNKANSGRFLCATRYNAKTLQCHFIQSRTAM